MQFNLAYSGEMALYAVAASLPVGVDLKKVRSLPNLTTLARRYFSPAEYAAFAGLPEQDRLPAFLRCWTRKEAYLKAIGQGRARPLDRVEVRFESGETVVRVDHAGREWALYDLEPATNYLGTLAVSGHQHLCRGWVVSAEQCLKSATLINR